MIDRDSDETHFFEYELHKTPTGGEKRRIFQVYIVGYFCHKDREDGYNYDTFDPTERA